MSHTVGVYGGGGFSSPLAQNDEVLMYYNPLEHQAAPAGDYHPSSALAPTPQRLELRHVRMPQHNDVLCGKGNGTKHHPGNVSYRAIVTKHKKDCVMAKKFHKPMYARAVVHEVRYKNPPGRFLMKGDLKKGENPALFYDIGDDAAIRKAAQALREGAVKIRDKETKTLVLGSNSAGLPREEFLFTTNSTTMVDGPRINSNATTGPPRRDSIIQGLQSVDERGAIGGSEDTWTKGVVSPPNYMTRNADLLVPKVVDLTDTTLSSALDDVAPKMSTAGRERRDNPRQVSILEGDIGSQFLNSDSLIEDFPPGNISYYEPISEEKVAERPLYNTGHHRANPHRVSVAAPDKSLITTSTNLGSSNEETPDVPPLDDLQIHDTDTMISDSLNLFSQGLSSSIEKLSLGRRQSEVSTESVSTWKAGDDPETDQESGAEEDWGNKFNDRTHRIKHSLESSFVLSDSVITDRMASIASSFDHDATSVEGDIGTNSFYPIIRSRASSAKRNSSSFGQLIESIFRSRKSKRRISIQDYIDMGPNKKVRLRKSSNLYPIGYDLFHSPGIYQELMKNISSISSFTPDEDDDPNDAFVRDSSASDEMRNWISKEICISEKERISELINEEDNFNEQDYTDEEAFDIASTHLMSGYTEDHGYLHQTLSSHLGG